MTVSSGDAATVSVFVKVALQDAFDVFTQEIDAWWRTGPQYRIAGKRRGTLRMEPKAGGRLIETYELPSGPRSFVIGEIVHWDPPHALRFEWRGVNFKPDEKTWVEVTFAALGTGTMVKVRHFGWSALAPEHPARHQLQGAEFARMIGMWWGGLMTSLREHVASTRPVPDEG